MSDEIYLPEEIMEWVGLKKSEYLSILIQNHRPIDIPIEEFHEFNGLVEGTIRKPDKLYFEEIDGYRVNTYVRAYDKGTQIVIGALFDEVKENSEIFVPILSLMSNDNDLIKIFTQGQAGNLPILN